jgi:dTMP kinase
MGKGLFIVLDGMDGSGKKHRILTTREPTNGMYGHKIRHMLARDTGPEEHATTLMELFLKDREEHVNTIIRPFLEQSNEHQVNIVICDRYYYSTIAFQAAQGLDMSMLIEKNRHFPKPTIAFILDLKPEIALERIKRRKKEKFEQREFMTLLRRNFLKLPTLLDDRIVVVDASRDLAAVFDSVKKDVETLI